MACSSVRMVLNLQRLMEWHSPSCYQELGFALHRCAASHTRVSDGHSSNAITTLKPYRADNVAAGQLVFDSRPTGGKGCLVLVAGGCVAQVSCIVSACGVRDSNMVPLSCS
jgi:hypothetical protein